jgi:hypothetical protein
MTSSQFDWRQFSVEHIQRETGQQEADNTAATTTYTVDPIIGDYDVQEPAFNKCSANRTTTSNAERRHHQRHSPLRSTKQAIPTTAAAAAAAADVKEAYEQVQKPKTRAERRATDELLVAETDTEALPATKKERRSDYWVQRDDERRNAARMFKTQTQVLSEDDEKVVPW